MRNVGPFSIGNDWNAISKSWFEQFQSYAHKEMNKYPSEMDDSSLSSHQNDSLLNKDLLPNVDFVGFLMYHINDSQSGLD